MKKALFIICTLFSVYSYKANATDLMVVYNQALQSDPVYQQAIAQRLVDKENVPITLSALLPGAGIALSPSLGRTSASGNASIPGVSTQKGYDFNLTLNQSVFNFGDWAALWGAKAISRQADAVLAASTQDLMLRVATAYFNVLHSEDTLVYIGATKKAFEKQLDQVKQQYNVGLKTITDVYTARASYENSVASYIAAENAVSNNRENLRAITGVLYPDLAKLREDFPFVTPRPANIEQWVTTATQQNWSVRAAQYAAQSAKENIKQQFSGHLPTLGVEGSYDINYLTNSSSVSEVDLGGAQKLKTAAVSLNLIVPLVQGGLVVAQTKQAQYAYQVATQQVEYQLRSAMNQTRQSYLGILAGISQLGADREAIKSAQSSLEGMQAGYEVGTEILVNVLDQQQKVFLSQEQYARDRYDYINNLLLLKNAAGTLSPEDLVAINAWLTEENHRYAPLATNQSTSKL